jgi:hypothetical protein
LATSFPSGLDALTNPTSANGLNSPDHAGQHADANDAIEALEAKVGVNGSAVVTSLDYKVTNGIFSALAVDTNVLVVDATNNRVGVNTASPGTAVDVVGTATVRAAATQDGVALAGRAGGTSSYEVTLTPTTLSADRILTLPDIAGTVVTTGDSGSVTSTMIADGTILNADINASAGIVDTKLATISTASKVSNSATTATSANTASAIVARDASGNFTAGTITSTQYLQGTDYLTPYQGFRNKIINGDFSINQRGFTSITASDTYGFDRWAFQASGGTSTMTPQTFTVGSPAATGFESANFFRLITASQSAAGDYSIFYQKIEDVRTFANSTITVSFWAKAGSGTPKIALEFGQVFGTGGSPSAGVNTYAGQSTISTSWARYSITATVPNINGKTIGTTANTSLLGMNFWVSAGSTFNSRTGSIGIQNNTFDIWGVQVERGSVATPFEQRPIQTELALCQRYYFRTGTHGGYVLAGFGPGSLVGPNGNVDAIFPLPVPMRIVPTSIGYSTLRITDYQSAFTIASITLSTIRTSTTVVQATVSTTSAMTLYRPYVIEGNNSTSAYFEASAEL